ncbi:MAG: adenylosuccinate lyase [Clostridiales Family XIII bacterium]|jgi:adenylosuccinate lyase|nr:adenylosuccinate lyase [Clostridiales Family XIII bacterium]
MKNDRYDTYTNPLTERYASAEMIRLFSPRVKFETWRTLWIALAEAEKELGLPITDEQIADLKKYEHDVDFKAAEAREREVRHDVMAHVYAYGKQAKLAAPIIHLGATSAYVGDNTDILVMRQALGLVSREIADLLQSLSKFALKYKDLPTLGFTHFQPAQPTTVGKRAALWMQDFLLDYNAIAGLAGTLPIRGVKGTTGTLASFLELFEGNEAKVKKLEKSVAKKIGGGRALPVIPLSGQTYTRKLDYEVLSLLSALAQSASKMATDIRLLQHLKEVEEPFEKKQIGSSAMAYKRNPMRSERVCSLARVLMQAPQVAAATEAAQWFERTLDDSACRRIAIPEAFMAADAILLILRNIAEGLVVNKKVIETHLMAELPFMATENILMAAVKKGGDRQELHERIREHAQASAAEVKTHGRPNDLLERIAADPAFGLTKGETYGLLKPELYTGMSARQVEDFVEEYIRPITRGKRAAKAELKV